MRSPPFSNFAAAKKIDPAALLRSRLAPDMFDLTRQVQVSTDQARRGSARLAGAEAPSCEDNETTIAELKARLAKTVAYLKTLDGKTIDAAAERQIAFPLGPTITGHMKGEDSQSPSAAEFLFPCHRCLRDLAPQRRRHRQTRLFGRYSDQDELILVYPGQRKGAMRPLFLTH
jgi:hypothetical protein